MHPTNRLAVVVTLSVGLLACSRGGERSVPIKQPAQVGLNIEQVFNYDGVLTDVLSRPLAQSEVRYPHDIDPTRPPYSVGVRFMRVEATTRGPRFRGYPNGVMPNDPGAVAQWKESRTTFEVFLPKNIDPNSTPTVGIFKAAAANAGPCASGDDGDTASDGLRAKRTLFRYLATQGIIGVIWTEEDRYPVDVNACTETLAHQFGYAGDGALQLAGFDWMRSIDPTITPLTVDDLRFDFRFAYAQGYMLAATFLQQYVAEDPAGLFANEYGLDQQRRSGWIDRMRVTVIGGSKRGGGVLSTGAVDPRVHGVRFAGYQGLAISNPSGPSRYASDWRECAATSAHRWAPFSEWANTYADVQPSWAQTYVPERDPQRYRHLLLLDIVGTHDWINPLGSHAAFWQSGAAQTPTPAINHRIVRRINADHGMTHYVGTDVDASGFRYDWSADNLLLAHALLHQQGGAAYPLPRFAVTEQSFPSGTDTWQVTLKLQDNHSFGESYKVYVAVSDDRDFRRCDEMIAVLNREASVCTDPDWDDNHPLEDVFYPVSGEDILSVEPIDAQGQADPEGAYRRVTFRRPAEVGQFSAAISGAPLVATVVEVRFQGPDPARTVDDLVLHSRVLFANDTLYAPHACQTP